MRPNVNAMIKARVAPHQIAIGVEQSELTVTSQ